MKSNTFNYSILAVGVAALMGVAGTANAATTGTTTTDVNIRNVATADYVVGGTAQPTVESNPVTITVSEQVSFSLVANNADESQGNDSNVNEEVAPSGFAEFNHLLTNTGNRQDTYTVSLQNLDANYVAADSTISYRIFNDNDDIDTATPVSTGTVPVTGGNIVLEDDQFAVITVNAKTNGNKGGDSQTLELQAVSTVLPAADGTLVNSNESDTVLPTFSIVKTITNGLDLNDNDDTATYQIVITNPSTAYSADATNIDITDNLPTGLIMATALSTTNITASGTATAGSIDPSNAGGVGTNGFNITGANIPVGESITIRFEARRADGATVAAGALNHVNVTDDLDDNAATDNTLIDSTDSTVENVTNFYNIDDQDLVNGDVADGTDGTDSTQPLLTIRRDLTLTVAETKEIGRNGTVTHQAVITNNGDDIEGDTAGELTFTITEAGTAANLDLSAPVTITYDADGAGSTQPGQPITITPTGGVYDIRTALPGGIAPGATATINYNLTANEAALNATETTTVTLIPANEGAPVVPTIQDITTIKGLTLVKSQALDDNCDGNADTVFSSSATPLSAVPGQCVIYQIEAQNTSSATPAGQGFNINNIVINDLVSRFITAAEYVNGSANTTVSSGASIITAANNDGTNINTEVTSLPPQGTATLQFSIQLKTDRAANP